MGMLRGMAIFGAGVAVSMISVRGHSPDAANSATTDLVTTGAQMVQSAGLLVGKTAEATGPAINGAKSALNQAGVGGILTTTTLPPAAQPTGPTP